MVCLYCGGKTSVKNSRLQKRSNKVWRRRQCEKCRSIFTTLEATDLGYTSLFVTKSGRSESFSPDKLYVEILATLKGQKNSYTNARELTTTVLSELTKQPSQASIDAKQISLLVSKVLKRFDRQAYLRYAAEHLSLQI